MADFSYFDQFTDMEIDLTPYLNELSTDNFKYTFNNIQPIKTTLKNLFDRQDIVIDYKKNIDLITRYDVKGDELIESVSHKKYGSVEYWWVVAIFNDIKAPFKDWPLSQSQLIDMAKNLYENEKAYSYETYLNMITEKNDIKRQLILPNNNTLKDIIWKYRQAIQNG